ncbi:WGR domain-containing protein [Micromonospora sp. BRA006-A]|nr:WGR domain-containing protein [Micromonospora sp. BRA006-A]
MSQETTYLELSEVDGGAHKFYEVVVDDTAMTVRYGRIGDQGQVKTSTFPDNARARAAAAKKIGEKVRKVRPAAVPGVRQKRTVSRRQIVSTRSTARTAPVLWRYASGAPAFGIFVDDRHCMVGNEHGVITTLDHDARLVNQVRLPDG